MVSRFEGFFGWGRRPEAEDERQKMIAETSAFLSWAMREDAELPRIPMRRVDEGGFGFVSGHRGAKALAERWWIRILEGTHFDRY